VAIAQRPAGVGRRPLAWSARLSYAFGPGALGTVPLALPEVEIVSEVPTPTIPAPGGAVGPFHLLLPYLLRDGGR